MVFAFTNQKGGVGKTTSAINIGVYLAKSGQKVLLVDLDPQANLTSGIGFKKSKQQRSIYNLIANKANAPTNFYKTKIENLCIIPSGIELAGAEIELVGAISRETILRQILAKIRNNFDYILIDCAPSLGLLTINALTAADYVLIPVQCEYFALEGLGQLINTVKLVKKNLNPTLLIGGVILTMYDTRTKLSREVAEEVKKYFKSKVFETVVPRNVSLSEAPSHGKPIEIYAPDSKGAKAYESLAKEIINLN